MIDLYSPTNKDILNLKKLDRINQVSEGHIIDAQDYLGQWHLSVVCKIQDSNESEYMKVNFLPYPKGNRDEWIQKSEFERLSKPF